jgi:carboxymethylenebutenolidase
LSEDDGRSQPIGPGADYDRVITSLHPRGTFWPPPRYGRGTLGGDLTLYIADDPIPGYLAVPAGTGPFPGVIVLHQAYGLDDDIRRQTDRVASLGYLAVAPDLVADGGWRCVAGLFRDLVRGKGEGVQKAEAVIDWVRKRADCNGKIGAIGFCLGGGFAYLLGLSGKIEATAPNYGRSPKALAGSCPVVASYGGRDRIFRRQAARVERALAGAGIPHDVKVYPQAGHGFMNHIDGHPLLVVAGRPFLSVGYEKDAAEDTWLRIESFFARYLGVSPPAGGSTATGGEGGAIP